MWFAGTSRVVSRRHIPSPFEDVHCNEKTHYLSSSVPRIPGEFIYMTTRFEVQALAALNRYSASKPLNLLMSEVLV